jgi:hypothetical protein
VEIVAYAWGKRDLRTAKKLGRRLGRLGISYGRIAADDWEGKLRNRWKAFATAFFISIMTSFDNPSYFVDHLRISKSLQIPKYFLGCFIVCCYLHAFLFKEQFTSCFS